MAEPREAHAEALPIKLDSTSNGEFEPVPLGPTPRHARALAREAIDDAARRIAANRRRYLRSLLGAAARLGAFNRAFAAAGLRGGHYLLPAENPFEMTAAQAALGGDEFIFDVQLHHVNPQGAWRHGAGPNAFRRMPNSNCGKADHVECFSSGALLKDVFFDSDTAMGVLSHVPGRHVAVLVALACPWPMALAQTPAAELVDPVADLVSQLDLEKYKAAIKGLTQFGDRRQGTERNRKALDWIEAQFQSYGCTNTERLQYQFTEPAKRTPAAPQPARAGGPAGQGGSTLFGKRAPTGVNTDPMAQPDERLRALNAEPTPEGTSLRESVYCTKVGSTRPDEMYIVGAHMDGIGWGEAANDDGSGTALVMELARVFSLPGVQTERSIRFVLWNNEETGLQGASAYVAQRKGLQGIESPKGSGKYPEPKWLGMIQHDMMLFDHGMPVPKLDASGKPVLDARGQPVYAPPKEQRAEADVNIEFQATSRHADAAAKLAWAFRAANDKYATHYPAAVGFHMTNTDSTPFMDEVPAISLRENERGMQIGAGWNPHWHQPTDLYSSYSDKDFLLGLNAAQTTLAAVAQLTRVELKK